MKQISFSFVDIGTIQLIQNVSSFAAPTSTNPRYHSYCFDKQTNLAANHCDTRIFLNRGLQVSSDTTGGLASKGGAGDNLLQSIDSNKIVKGLCASNYYIAMDFFDTYTCNQLHHFGVKGIKRWVDSIEWENNYEGFHQLDVSSQEEIRKAMSQASSTLLLRNWQEVSKLFVEYLQKSPSSPFRRVGGIFIRYEYQKDAGNLSHIHLILQVKWEELTPEEKDFMDDIIRASKNEIVRPEEIQRLIDEGIFKSHEDWYEMQELTEKFLPHVCNERCQMRVDSSGGSNDTKCRKLNNNKISPDITKHSFIELPRNWSKECIDRLVKIGLAEVISNEEIKYHHDFFTPKRHIPPTMSTHDMNMSPVEGKTFAACQSMQNIQMLTDCGGVNKYVCKYIGKIDEQNYVVIYVNGESQFVTKEQFLHNTKITTSKKNEDDARQKDRFRNHPQGRAISQNEMVHLLLKYPETITNLNFIHISTLPLEFRAGTEQRGSSDSLPSRRRNRNQRDGTQVNVFNAIRDSARTDNFASARIREEIDNFPTWRKHTNSEHLTFDSVEACNLTVDMVSKFSLRPCEFRKAFPQMRQFYRFFEYSGKVKEEDLENKLSYDIKSSYFIDGLLNQIKVREEALDEVKEYLHKDIGLPNLEDENYEAIKTIIDLFDKIFEVIKDDTLDDEDEIFKTHVKENLLISHGPYYTLHTPVFSYTRPSNGAQFILHIMLSMGKFDTEIDLSLQGSLRDSLQYSQLIGSLHDPDALTTYSNNLMVQYFKEQVVTFPNSKYVLQSWIVQAAELFDSVIIDNELTTADLPAVQQSILFNQINEKNQAFLKDVKSKVIDAALKELGPDTIQNCQIPTKDELMASTKDNPIEWDPVENFCQNDGQPIQSYTEQKVAVKLCKDAIDNYFQFDTSFVKCTGIRGAAGSGKTWVMEYSLIYTICQGLNVITTSHMARRAIQLGGKHIAYLFGIPYSRSKLTPQRCTELALHRIMRNPVLYNFLRALDVLCVDELAQSSSNMLAILDIIMKRVKGSQTFMGGLLVYFTLDHLQTQPINERPILTSPQIVPCFQMVKLQTSVRAARDPHFQRIQTIARMPLSMLQDENNDYVDEFISLINNHCTFVPNWNDPIINERTYRLYSKKVPAKAASRQYAERVRRCLQRNEYISRTALDVQKQRFSHSDWVAASQSTIDQIELIKKEPTELLLFRGGQYEFTFNKENEFSQSQMALLYDLPSQEDVDSVKKIKILCAPPGLKNYAIDIGNVTKEDLLSEGFTEVSIGIAPERTLALKNNIQAKRKQYGLQHRVTNTIHGAQGQTLLQMATEISLTNPDFNIWDKGQLIVILTRTKKAIDTIFVGNKQDTLDALKHLLLSRTQWTDYIEHILRIVTVNESNPTSNVIRTMNQNDYPFRICDISLPSSATGFVYFLLSIKDKSFTYIGSTICIRERLPQHNSGFGSFETCPINLRPYALMAYICGSRLESKHFRLYLERKWKIHRDSLIARNNFDPRSWAREAGQITINEAIQEQMFQVDEHDMKLVLLFNE